MYLPGLIAQRLRRACILGERIERGHRLFGIATAGQHRAAHHLGIRARRTAIGGGKAFQIVVGGLKIACFQIVERGNQNLAIGLAGGFLPGRQLRAVGGTDKRLTLHSLEDPAAKTVVVERPVVVMHCTASRDGSVFALGDYSGWVGLFAVARLLASEEPLREGPARDPATPASVTRCMTRWNTAPSV